MEGSIIHQRQRELVPGRWDMVVFGPSRKKKGGVLRALVAEQLVIQQASVYMASIGDPAIIGGPGMISLDELSGGDLSDELSGLEIYNISPIRPIDIVERREWDNFEKMRDLALKEFSDKNIALIETPDESAWSLAALKYLDQLDEIFPDPLMSVIRSTMRERSLDFRRLFHETIN
jgi:hypothetical protein